MTFCRIDRVVDRVSCRRLARGQGPGTVRESGTDPVSDRQAPVTVLTNAHQGPVIDLANVRRVRATDPAIDLDNVHPALVRPVTVLPAVDLRATGHRVIGPRATRPADLIASVEHFRPGGARRSPKD